MQVQRPPSVLFLLPFLASCAGMLTHVPNPAKPIDSSRVVHLPFEEAWHNAVAWFANHNLTIDKIEKDSGLITAAKAVLTDDQDLDAGTIQSTGNGATEPVVTRLATLNALLRPKDGESTEVSLNVFGSFHATATYVDFWSGIVHPMSLTGRCSSTGRLEQLFFDFVARH